MAEPQDGKGLGQHREENCSPNRNTHIELLRKGEVKLYCAVQPYFGGLFVTAADPAIPYTSICVNPVCMCGRECWVVGSEEGLVRSERSLE